jgi:HD-GYP domain-containing protein (c-di-GMP phosphodiesterase class II)
LLLRRIVAAALIIATLLAVLVYVMEQGRLRGVALDLAVQRAAQFAAEAADSLAKTDVERHNKVQARLDRFTRSLVPPREGRIVAVTIYAVDGSELARFSDPDYSHGDIAAAFLTAQGPTASGQQSPQGRTFDIADTRHFFVRFPVRGTDGATLGNLSAVFEPSNAYLADLHKSLWRTVLVAMTVVFSTAALLYPFIARLMRRVTTLSDDLLDANLEMLSVIGSAIAKRDADTDTHNYRVTIYSVRLAEAIGLDDKSMRALIKGAFLHDVGKIGIPDHILLKPGKLDEAEFAEMKKHVAYGLDIVRRASWLSDAQDVIAFHHKKYDGAGYGPQLNSDTIPITARIFAIADVFDALTSRRPYKEPLDIAATMAIMEQSRGSHFDPWLLDIFAGIAHALLKEFGDRDDDHPRESLYQIVRRYFIQDLEALLT